MGLKTLEIKDPKKKVVTQIRETFYLFNTIFPPNREFLMIIYLFIYFCYVFSKISKSNVHQSPL